MFPFSRRSPTTETPAAQVEEVRSLADPDTWLETLFGSATSTAGVTVTPTTAMRVPAARGAVQAISEAIGSLPTQIVETTATGERRAKQGHPLDRLLNLQANLHTLAGAAREQIVRDALLHGHGAMWIGRDAAGEVHELIRIRPADLTIDEDAADLFGAPIYRIRGTLVNPSNLLLLRCPLGPSGAAGISPIRECADAIGLALVLEETAARLFKNATRPGGIISFPKAVPPTKLAELRNLWTKMYSRVGLGGTAVLDDGASFTQAEFSSVDAQFAELRAYQTLEIARAFRVPPVLLQEYGRATWSNSATMGRLFVDFTLSPWLRKLEAEYAVKLLKPEEQGRLRFEFDTDQLTNSDPLVRAQAAQAFRSSGIYTANELRRIENLPPHPDGDSLASPFTTAGASTSNPSTTGPSTADKTDPQPENANV